jgi:tetratricopeptide (TPR) repeat protein
MMLVLVVPCTTSCIKNYSRFEVAQAEFPNPQVELDEINRVLKSKPSLAPAHQRKAYLLLNLGKYEEALVSARQAVKLDKNNPRNHFLLAEAFYHEELFDMAYASAVAAEQMGLNLPELFLLLAVLSNKKGELKQAERYLGMVGQVYNTPQPDILYVKAFIALGQQDSSAHVQYLQQALSIDSTFVPAHIALAEWWVVQENPAQSLFHWEAVLTVDSTHIEALEKAGIQLAQLQRWEDQRLLLMKLTELRPYVPDLWIAIGQNLRNDGLADSALYYFKKSYNLTANKDVGMEIARTLDLLRQYPGAIEMYEAILERDSTYYLAQEELDKLQRKVAYLTRLRQEQERKPLPALEPKRTIVPVQQ